MYFLNLHYLNTIRSSFLSFFSFPWNAESWQELLNGLDFKKDLWISSLGKFYQHTSKAFLRQQEDKLFSANKLGKIWTVFGKNFVNLSLKFEVLIIVEIEQQSFVHQQLFDGLKKFGEIDPMCHCACRCVCMHVRLRRRERER